MLQTEGDLSTNGKVFVVFSVPCSLGSLLAPRRRESSLDVRTECRDLPMVLHREKRCQLDLTPSMDGVGLRKSACA